MFEAGFTYILSKSLMNTRTKKGIYAFVWILFFVLYEKAGLEPPRRRRTKSGVRKALANDGQSPSSPVSGTKKGIYTFVWILFFCIV